MRAYEQGRNEDRRKTSSGPQVGGRRHDDPPSSAEFAAQSTLYGTFHFHFPDANITFESGAVTIYAQPTAAHGGADQSR